MPEEPGLGPLRFGDAGIAPNDLDGEVQYRADSGANCCDFGRIANGCELKSFAKDCWLLEVSGEVEGECWSFDL